MLKNLFSSNRKLTKCLVFYSVDFKRSSTRELFHFLVDYFKSKLDIDFKYLGFYDERYENKYGKFETNYLKLQNAKWDDIVNLSLDVENIRDKKRGVGVEFNITRPVHITVVLDEEVSFNMVDFVKEVYGLFKVVYGFSYLTKDSYWATAYAIGDFEHSRSVQKIKRLSKDSFRQWLNNSEKISAGFLRDIYEENLLNFEQLNKSLNEKTLKEYIVSEGMGVLSPVNGELFFWKMNDGQLKEAREVLYKTDLLI